jgi:hypothetical protein
VKRRARRAWTKATRIPSAHVLPRTFDLPDPIDGGRIDADTLARITAANLHDELAQVMSTDELIAGS